MERIPQASELTQDEMRFLRRIVAQSFTPGNQIDPLPRLRLIELGLIQRGMGGLMPTPAGRIVSRM